MSYPYRCILPMDRYLICAGDVPACSFLPADLAEADLSSTDKWMPLHDGAGNQLVVSDLEIRCKFAYEKFLIAESERLLRDLALNYDINVGEALTESENVSARLRVGYVHEALVIDDAGVIDGVDVGMGLFAGDDIPFDTFLGEYTGLLSNSSQRASISAYCVQYPSCDGGTFIDASACGNLTRFINHSTRPNAAFRSYFFDGSFHIVCVSNACDRSVALQTFYR